LLLLSLFLIYVNLYIYIIKKRMTLLLFVVVIFIFQLLNITDGKDIQGTLSLDKYTFDKIINNGNFNVLVKFDEEYPYGNQQDEFEKFVDVMNKQAQHETDFVIANVIVEKKEDGENKKKDDDDMDNNDDEDNNNNADDKEEDKGEDKDNKDDNKDIEKLLKELEAENKKDKKETNLENNENNEEENKNEDQEETKTSEEDNTTVEKLNQVFVERFAIDQKHLPVYLLFKNNNNNKEVNPIKYNGKITADALTIFVKKELGLTLLLKGCLEEWNKIVTDFVKLSKEKQLEKIAYVEKEVNQKNKENNKDESVSANIYFTIMKRITEKGKEFVQQEQKRIQHILDNGKITEETKNRMKMKLNILTNFN